MKLNLNKPIVFFDLETTGIDVARDHIVELCYIKIYPCGNEYLQAGSRGRLEPELRMNLLENLLSHRQEP